MRQALAALFGLGWGLVGFCPGPGRPLGFDDLPVPVFVLAMLAGMLHRLRPSGRAPEQMATPAHSG